MVHADEMDVILLYSIPSMVFATIMFLPKQKKKKKLNKLLLSYLLILQIHIKRLL